jgi:hypothetical protein
MSGKNQRIVCFTAEGVLQMLASGGDGTDWHRVKNITQAEVERLADQASSSAKAEDP